MSESEAFLDTNVLIYLLSADTRKADLAQACLLTGGIVSVQVLNEFAAVTLGKLKLPWPAVQDSLETFRRLLKVTPLTIEVHERGLEIARRHRLSVYDGQILAAADLAGCDTVLSEDMAHGLRIGERLVIQNPFRA
jgi:predicted nucleic acid-binding protein